MAQLKEVRPVLTGVSVEEVSVEEGSAGEETEDSIFHGKKDEKRRMAGKPADSCSRKIGSNEKEKSKSDRRKSTLQKIFEP